MMSRIGSVLGVTLLVLGASACKKEAAAPPPTQAAVVPLAADDVVAVTREPLQTGPRVSGSLDPREKAQVRAEIGGSVLEVAGELGQPVKKGQLLARIEARAEGDRLRSSQAALRSAEEAYKVAQREVERTTALVEGGALARRDIETSRSAAIAAEARVGEAKAALASARTQVGNATVTAPMDGVISAQAVHQGDVVSPGAPLFTIIDPSSMRLEAAVSSADLAALEVGTEVRFEVRGYPGQSFAGAIERVAPAADPTTRQIGILVGIPNPGGKLVAGLFADGRVQSGKREAVVVPSAALDTAGEAPSVTRVKDGVVERVAVQVGVRDPGAEKVEIVTGVAPGDVVLLRAARAMTPGTRVALPTGAAPTAPPAKTAER